MGQIKPQKNILTVWRIWLVIGTFPFALLNSLLFPTHSKVWICTTAAWVVLFLLGYLYYLPTRYRKLSFAIHEEQVVLYSGVLYTRVRTLPVHNIQYTTILRTPLDHPFGLCSLALVAPGGRITLPGLRLQDAKTLSSLLNNKHQEDKHA